MTIYADNGYINRADYLKSLAEEYCIPFEYVKVTADLLGPDEDFDGLITLLEDYADDIE